LLDKINTLLKNQITILQKSLNGSQYSVNKWSCILLQNISSSDSFLKFGSLFEPENIPYDIKDWTGYEEESFQLLNFLKFFKNLYTLNQTESGTMGMRTQLKLPLNLTITALLFGPPGTGKTMLTMATAKKLNLPVFLVYSDTLVSQYLGNTLHNIYNVLDGARKFTEKIGNSRPLIVFFDEIDAIVSERSSIHEVGEIKRAVTAFLQRIDEVSRSGAPIAIIGATNHERLLDSAVWRRFTTHISFRYPNTEEKIQYIKNKLTEIENAEGNAKLNVCDIKGISFDRITEGYTLADIDRGLQMAYFMAFGDKKVGINQDILINALKKAGGTEIHVKNQQRSMGLENEEYSQSKTEQNSSKLREK